MKIQQLVLKKLCNVQWFNDMGNNKWSIVLKFLNVTELKQC